MGEGEGGVLKWPFVKSMSYTVHNLFGCVLCTRRLLTGMETKIIYFTVNGRPEQAEFPTDCPTQDVKGKDFVNLLLYLSSIDCWEKKHSMVIIIQNKLLYLKKQNMPINEATFSLLIIKRVKLLRILVIWPYYG